MKYFKNLNTQEIFDYLNYQISQQDKKIKTLDAVRQRISRAMKKLRIQFLRSKQII